jgi:hypothetical protein
VSLYGVDVLPEQSPGDRRLVFVGAVFFWTLFHLIDPTERHIDWSEAFVRGVLFGSIQWTLWTLEASLRRWRPYRWVRGTAMLLLPLLLVAGVAVLLGSWLLSLVRTGSA